MPRLFWDAGRIDRQAHESVNVPSYTSSSLTFAMNTTDHINVVFRKFAYSLMSRVVASPNSIVIAIVNSEAYRQSPLMDTWEWEWEQYLVLHYKFLKC